MTDFKGINPDKNMGSNFNPNRQSKGGKPDHQPAPGDSTPAADPYADLKMDPSRMLDLLATQGKLNIQNNFENMAVERSMNSFSSMITPERHAQVSHMMQQAYTDEFGTTPKPGVLQDMVDNYLIGQVSVQNS